MKDVLQESFLKIFASVGRFSYKGEGSLKAWMTKILVNEALKHINLSQRIDFTELPDNFTDTADCEDRESGICDIPASVIHELIRGLPDGYRVVFNLYAIEGKTHREIATLLGIGESTSASQFHRAKALLASRIKDFINRRSS